MFAAGMFDVGAAPSARHDALNCRLPCPPASQGGNLVAPDGNNMTAAVTAVKDCCLACQELAACGAYSYVPSTQTCYFKASAAARLLQLSGRTGSWLWPGLLPLILLPAATLSPPSTARAESNGVEPGSRHWRSVGGCARRGRGVAPRHRRRGCRSHCSPPAPQTGPLSLGRCAEALQPAAHIVFMTQVY